MDKDEVTVSTANCHVSKLRGFAGDDDVCCALYRFVIVGFVILGLFIVHMLPPPCMLCRSLHEMADRSLCTLTDHRMNHVMLSAMEVWKGSSGLIYTLWVDV